ncbi:hypothetical protein QFZ45_003936 [Pseudomonas synxantha]|nr:hypothetical protein [Pseudomonas synxantha]
MARGGGPPNPCRITGTPSLGEVPSGGARAFGYFALFKVTRCKSGTNSGRYLNNGYVLGLIQHPGQLSGRHREQAPSHIWIETISQALVGCQAAIGNKPPPTFGPRASVRHWSAVRPLSGASPLPHLDREHQSGTGRLSDRYRERASSHIWTESISQALVSCQAAIGSKLPPTFGPRASVRHWSAVRPLSGASSLPHLDREHQSGTGQLSGRYREQAPSHIWTESISQALVSCQAAIGSKPPPTFGPRASVRHWSAVRPLSGASPLPHLDREHQSDTGQLSGRYREQASSHIWTESISQALVGCGQPSARPP